MHARTYNVLALALSAALLSPLAMAQKIKAGGPAVGGNAAAQVTRSVVPATPRPTDVATQARDVVPDARMTAQKIPTAAGTEVKLGANVDGMDAGVAARAQAETRAAAPSKVAREAAFGQLDSDADGRISSTEAEADADFQARFGTIDSDGDGLITDAEYKLFAKTQVSPAQPGQAQGAVHAAGHSSVVQRGTFAPLDADADGRISLTEAAADADFTAGFGMMDGDGDGFVTDAEFRAHAKAGRGAP